MTTSREQLGDFLKKQGWHHCQASWVMDDRDQLDLHVSDILRMWDAAKEIGRKEGRQ